MGQSLSSLSPSQIANFMNETDICNHENSADGLASYCGEILEILIDSTVGVCLGVCLSFPIIVCYDYYDYAIGRFLSYENVETSIDLDAENSVDSYIVQSTRRSDDRLHWDPFKGLKPKTTSFFCWGGHEENDGKKMVTHNKNSPIDAIRFIEDIMLNVYSFLPCRERIAILPSVDKRFLHDPSRCGFAWPHKCVTIGRYSRTSDALTTFTSALVDKFKRAEKEVGIRERKIASEPNKRRRYRLRRKLKKDRKNFDDRFLKLSKLSMELNEEWDADKLPCVKAVEKFEYDGKNSFHFPTPMKYHECDFLTERIRKAKCEQEFQSFIIDHGMDWNNWDMGSLKSRTNYFLPDTGGGVKRFELLQCYGCSKVVPYDELGSSCNERQHFECKTCFKKKAEDKNKPLTRYGGTCPMCLHKGYVPIDWDRWSSGER